jgi:hypothetical protein
MVVRSGGRHAQFHSWHPRCSASRLELHTAAPLLPALCTFRPLAREGLPTMPLQARALSRTRLPSAFPQLTGIERAVVAPGLPYHRKDIIGDIVGDIFAFVSAGSGLRRTGSTILDLCWMAEGRLDALWDRDLKPWDLCGASVILFEAGGRVSGPAGEAFDIHQTQAVASNGIPARRNCERLAESQKAGHELTCPQTRAPALSGIFFQTKQYCGCTHDCTWPTASRID